MRNVLQPERDAIVRVLGKSGKLPGKTLFATVVAIGYRDADVRAALWYLIDDREVHLTPDLDLRLPEQPE